MSEPKAGQTVTLDVGRFRIVIEPVPYGNIKKLLKLFVKAIEEIGAASSMSATPEVIERYMPEVLPLFFPKGSEMQKLITSDWIDDNLTVAQLKEIIETAVAVNGLKDFLGQSRTPKAVEVPATSVPSTTSSDSPTVGDPSKSTS